MPDYVTLIGAEDVTRAGNRMSDAASDMLRAAASIEDSLYRHRQFLDEWLGRFEAALRREDADEG